MNSQEVAPTALRMAGGCNTCDAYQVLSTDPVHPRIHWTAVFHDDDCPTLARHQGRTP
jgi:hypothetical protein